MLKGIRFGKQGLKDLLRHIYIIGQTGTGKTTFLVNRFLEYMSHGAVVIITYKDQKTTEEYLQSIPDKDKDRVIYLNPVEKNRKIGFSTFGKKYDDVSISNVVGNMIQVYKTLFGDQAIGPRSEYIFRNVAWGVAEMPVRTPIEVYKCLINSPECKDYRDQIRNNTKNVTVKSFFQDRLEEMVSKDTVMLAPINKQDKLVSDPTIRYTLCQSEPKLDLEEAINEGKIIIANFNQELLGPELAQFLSSFFFSQLQLTIFSREDKSTPVFAVLDEFQNYVTPTFGKFLSEARSFNASLTLAHQYTSQIPQYLQDAIDGNVANKYWFRVGKKDSKVLQDSIAPDYAKEDLVKMKNFHYLKEIMIKGEIQDVVKEKAPEPAKEYGNANYIIRRSNKLYGRSTWEIDKDINKRFFNGSGKDPDIKQKNVGVI